MAATLSQIAATAGASLPGNAQGESIIDAISLDSQALPDGGLFAALPGTHTHGAHFAAGTTAAAILTDAEGQAILDELEETRPVLVVEDIREVLGPVAALISGHPSESMTVIGITGTSGKTTTSHMVEAGLRASGKKVGLIGTNGTRIDGRDVATKLTTPEAPRLQELFATMKAEGVTHVVMEVSSHALALRRVKGTRFSVGAFTNLSQDHLDFHPDMEDYFLTKAMLFDPASSMSAQRSVVCTDDEWGSRMATIAGEHGDNVVTVDTHGEHATLEARDIATQPNGTQHFTVSGIGDIQIAVPGRFNVANATVALGIAEQLDDVDTAAFAAGLHTVSVPGRMERIDSGQDFIAVVDYAHKPAAVHEVLETLAGEVDGRIGVVLGAGGNRDHGKRPQMGALAARGADLVIITDDNPRDEEPGSIRADVLRGAREEQTRNEHAVDIKECGDRREAIRMLINWATSGDAVVVAGKGHENGQLIGSTNHHFDDREEVRLALAARLNPTDEPSREDEQS